MSIVAGDTIWNIDITAPILRCRQLGYKDSDIVVDIIMNNRQQVQYQNVTTYNSFRMMERAYEVMRFFGEK
jgi:hypothetical protein